MIHAKVNAGVTSGEASLVDGVMKRTRKNNTKGIVGINVVNDVKVREDEREVSIKNLNRA